MCGRDCASRLTLVALLFGACGGTPSSSDSPPVPVPTPAGTAPGPPPLPCPVPEPAGSARTTYYVAINEPGADNENCNGLSPVNEGGGRCPFKDFQHGRTFRLLDDVAGVRVEVRGGTYTFANEAITIHGVGRSDAERVVLTAYRDEGVVFDGRSMLREVLRLSGGYATVERVTLQNAGAYNIEVRGGHDHRIQCNRFLQNFLSDSLKGDAGAARTQVRYNDFSGWNSQAVDMTDVHEWTVEENVFHDPLNPATNSVIAKFGSSDVRISRNLFRNTGGVTLGGVSSPHPHDFEAYRVVAEQNVFENLTDHPVRFYSCLDCEFRDNDVKGSHVGIVLGGEQRDGPSGCPGGCEPTRGAVVARNRLRDLTGTIESPPNVFWGVYPSEAVGLRAFENLYCVSPGGEARFAYGLNLLRFRDWTAALGTDSTSVVATANDGVCVGW